MANKPKMFELSLVFAVALALQSALASQSEAQSAQPPARGEAESPATVEQVSRWVAELDDDRFDTRTRATAQLTRAGVVAIDPLTVVARQGSLEAATRAIFVLDALATSMDVVSQEKGLTALQQLAASERRAVARQASQAIDRLATTRQRQTLQQLSALGASVERKISPGLVGVNWLEVDIGAQWRGKPEDLDRLHWLVDLQKLTLAGPQISDEVVEKIAALPSLTYLAVKSAPITDESMRVISGLKSVIYLDLMYCPVTDAGFNMLRDMKSVRMIRCFGTKVTKAASDKFMVDLARITVDYKKGAFLGVLCSGRDMPCEVLKITEGSAAERAGLEEHDIIVRYDKNDVATFKQLQELIAQNRVGESVEIDVVRGGEPKGAAIAGKPARELGLEGTATPIGVKVTKVLSGGAAAGADVQIGDLIMGVDGTQVRTIAELEQLYAKASEEPYRALQFLRNSSVHTMKVTFGEWAE